MKKTRFCRFCHKFCGNGQASDIAFVRFSDYFVPTQGQASQACLHTVAHTKYCANMDAYVLYTQY